MYNDSILIDEKQNMKINQDFIDILIDLSLNAPNFEIAYAALKLQTAIQKTA